jgi:L-lactate dehydrogenase
MPVSMPLNGEYGLHNVALSLPSIIGRHGVEKRIPLPLANDEEELMQKSAESIQAVLRGNGVIA